MRKSKLNGSLSNQPVTPEDVMKLFDDINAETLLAILELHPRVADLGKPRYDGLVTARQLTADKRSARSPDSGLGRDSRGARIAQ